MMFIKFPQRIPGKALYSYTNILKIAANSAYYVPGVILLTIFSIALSVGSEEEVSVPNRCQGNQVKLC